MTGMGAFERDLLEQLPLILAGLEQTLKLAVFASLSGFLLGIVIFYCSISHYRVVRKVTQAYISFFIGMPLIVLLFLMYYGLPQWGLKLSPFTVAMLGFTMNIAAYNAAYLNTAFNGLDSAELQAAQAQGFSTFEIFQLIILPQVLRQSIPALTNQCIGNLKDSSVAFLIQYTEFFARVQELASTNFQFFKAYMFAACVYLVLVSVIVLVARQIERRFLIPS
jgi:polar amino acid transport system permease protein